MGSKWISVPVSLFSFAAAMVAAGGVSYASWNKIETALAAEDAYISANEADLGSAAAEHYFKVMDSKIGDQKTNIAYSFASVLTVLVLLVLKAFADKSALAKEVHAKAESWDDRYNDIIDETLTDNLEFLKSEQLANFRKAIEKMDLSDKSKYVYTLSAEARK